MNEMLYINVNSVGLNPEVVNRLNQSNIKILYDFNKYSLEEIENILGDMFSQIKSILIYYKLPRSINKLTKSKELVFLLEYHGISDLLTLVKYSKFVLYQILKDDQSLLEETNKILEFYGKERVTDRFKNTSYNKNIQIKEPSEIIINTNKNKISSSKQSIRTEKRKYVTTHSTGKPSDFIFSESRNVRPDVLNKELSDSRKIIEEEITVDDSQTKNTVRQTIEVLTIPVESLKLSQTALDRLKLSGIARLEDFNTFNLKELQMLLGNSFDEVLPTLIYFRLPRDIKDLSLSNETIGLLSMYGIADTMTLIEYDRGKLYELFSIDKFLLNEINNLFELYNENPLTSETIRTKSPKKLSDTYMNFSRKEITKVLTIPIEQLKITEETYDALLIVGIKTLGDLNKFNLRDLQLLMGYSFDELLPILVYYKIPRDLSKLSLSSETISILKKAGISDSKTLLRHNTRILTDIFKDKAVLLKEVQQIMKLYFSKNTVEENSIIDVNKKITVTSKKTCEYNGVEANKNGSRSLLDVLYSLYPKYNKTPNIIDLNIIFKQGIMIMGWEEFSRLINNESEINKQLNLKPFKFNIQQQFNKFKQLNIVDRIFLKTPEGNYIKTKDERTNFDKLYDVFINTSIFFMDYKDEYKFDFSNTKLKKLIEQFTFNTISYNNIDKKNFNRIQCYYDEFKKINGNEIHNFIHSQNEVFQFVKGVQTNKEKFKKSLHLMDLYSVLDLAVDGLHPDNYHIQLDKVLSTELSDLLKEKNIHNLIDFKRINTKDILQLNELSTFHDELYNVILDLNKSYLDEIYDLLYEMSEKLTDRDTFVLINRAKNRTLEQIGKKLGVTRERIRQIENKQYRKLVTSNAMKKILRILEKVQKDISIITQDDVNKIGKEQAWLLETLLKKYWNRSLGIYLIDIKDYEVLKLKYKELDEHYSVEDSEYTSLDEISKLIIDSKYHKLGKHYFKKRPTKPVEYKIIVEKYFEEGLHIYNENHIKKFKRYYGYEYETNELEDMSSRAFSGRIVAITGLVPFDRGFYRMQDYELPLDLIKKLKADVIKHQSLMISTLYARNKSDLKKASIKNRYQLHGVLNKYLSEFHLNRDMISVSQHHQSSSTSILDVLFQHEPGEISISDIKKAIPGITDIVLYSYITNRGDYVSVDYGKIKHFKELIFSSTDHNKIHLKISNMLKSRHFITTEALYDEIIGYEFHHIIEQNRITSKRFMYNFIQHYYRDEFQFTNYTILPLGEEYISVEDRIISIVKPHNKIIIKELMDQIENNGIKINSKQNILSLIYEQGYLRIDDETIIKKELLNFPEVFINQIENLLIDSMLGNRITTKQITNYSQFPKIKIPWNKHLLGNLMINFSRKIKVKDISKSYVDIEFEFKEKKK